MTQMHWELMLTLFGVISTHIAFTRAVPAPAKWDLLITARQYSRVLKWVGDLEKGSDTIISLGLTTISFYGPVYQKLISGSPMLPSPA